MSRSIQNIQSIILSAITAQPALSGLTSPSQVSIYNLLSYVEAVSMNIEENLWDTFQANLEENIANYPIGTDGWVNAQVDLFQYDATTPQIVYLTSGFTWYYPIVDPTLQIISRSSVHTQPSRNVLVKVATSEPPQALTTGQKVSLQGFLNTISFAGVQYNVYSYNPDYLLLGAQVYYDGQYTSTITAATLNAFNTYMQNIPFDSYVINSKIEEAILSVPGVSDVVINNVAIRPNTVPFSQTTYLIQNNLEIQRRYPLFAGYCVGEVQTGQTFGDQMIFISN